MRNQQLYFLPKPLLRTDNSFGGSLLRGKRKRARPISTKRPMHMVLKSSFAVGGLSFLVHRSALERVLSSCARRWGVRLMDHQWNSNHVHLIIRVSSRTLYRRWIRDLTASLVLLLARKTGFPLKRFFDHRPFTRVLNWGKDLRNAIDYLELNEMEVFGCRPKKKGTMNPSIKPQPGGPSILKKSRDITGSLHNREIPTAHF